MGKKIAGIVLIILGLITVFLGIKAVAGTPKNREIIESAVYVGDGKLMAENEGKVVIVHGTLDAELPYVDEETGIVLNSIVAYRRVEKLAMQYDSEKEDDYWEWRLYSDPNYYGGTGKVVAEGVTLGEYAVADQILLAIDATENHTEYEKKELNRFGWDTFEDNERVYLYMGDHMPCDDTRVIEKYYLDYVDTFRVTYDVIPEDNTLEYTVIGLQKNGKLEEVEELDLLAIHSGSLTADDLLAYAKSSGTTATIAVSCIAVLLLGVGIFLILKSRKK